MAIARLSMKVGKAGKALAHAAYIARTGRYANRLRQGERMVAQEAGNMPAWAKADPLLFWEAADAHERSNGTTYREMEIALPRELSPKELRLLVGDWVRQEIGDRHAYQWAIHVPKAADGGDQPHVHLMFSERQVDGIERDPDVYFKRFNAKSPEKGGARKGYGPAAGQTLTASERAAHLKELRSRWEVSCNKALAAAGQKKRIDMRSLKDRGVTREPEGKVLPSLWRVGGREKLIELRAATAELTSDRAVLRAAMSEIVLPVEVPHAPVPATVTVAGAAPASGRVVPSEAADLRKVRSGVLGQGRAADYDGNVPRRAHADVALRDGSRHDGLHQIPAPARTPALMSLPQQLRIRALAARRGWKHTGTTYIEQFREKVPAARPPEQAPAERRSFRAMLLELAAREPGSPAALPLRTDPPAVMAASPSATAPVAATAALPSTTLLSVSRPVPMAAETPAEAHPAVQDRPPAILPSRKAQRPPAAPPATPPAAPPVETPHPVAAAWSPRDEASPELRMLMGSILDMTMTKTRQPQFASQIKPILQTAWKALGELAGDLVPRFQAWISAILPRQKDPAARAEITEVSSWRKPIKQLISQFEDEGRLPRSPGPRPPGRGGPEL